MKIIYKLGDLLEAPERCIVHGCNSRGAFGSGVAGAIRRRYPMAYEVYRRAYEDTELKLGQIIWADCRRHLIGHAITQENFGNDGKRYVDYEAVRVAMQTVNQRPIKFVAMPRLGAQRGGGSWDIIASIIEQELTIVQPVVYCLEGIAHEATEENESSRGVASP